MTDEAERGPIERHHERTDINPKYIAAFAAILVCVTLVLYVLVWGVFDHFAARVSPAPARPSLEGEPQVFPSPRLQVDPQQDLEQLRRRERELLDRYGWVDRDAGIVRIPIERAIDIVSEKGLPDFEKPKEGGGTK